MAPLQKLPFLHLQTTSVTETGAEEADARHGGHDNRPSTTMNRAAIVVSQLHRHWSAWFDGAAQVVFGGTQRLRKR